MGGALVLFFFASQLIALFKKTNLGPVFSIWVGNLIETLSFSSIPLVLIFFLLVLLINMFTTSSVTKWAILAPVVVPTFMKANITPEFTQAIFRAGESITNMFSPLFPYFVIFIGMMLLYNKNEETIKIRDVYKLLTPYLIGIFIFWVVLLICWYIINLPIGANVYPIL
jgi:aminobenzoyl-glutamate transport protein